MYHTLKDFFQLEKRQNFVLQLLLKKILIVTKKIEFCFDDNISNLSTSLHIAKLENSLVDFFNA